MVRVRCRIYPVASDARPTRHSVALLQAELARVEREVAKTKASAIIRRGKRRLFCRRRVSRGRWRCGRLAGCWVPQHQDASVTLEEAYRLLVEGSLRSDGMFVDQDLYSGGSVFYIPWALYTL